ncbi:yrdC domain-containing protein, mitochondrial isoform X1 [Morone saxatilis]|uniref:yrdC domain-containing protein, mitochondrial isoform X1 n=1 Tax=Morone saxatilis TaxID=34816 RepID=UPI0015E1F8D1|nr:yrdC domain-containing protein, mitochondrial isoform X1 [Morone saxatilis]
MKSVCNIAGFLKPGAAPSPAAAPSRLGAEMCKELKTKVLRLLPPTSNGPSVQQGGQTDGAEILSYTVKALKEGHVVAVPTDTIYGLACLAQNSEAIRKTYDIKGRNGQKPLAICVGETRDIYKYCKVPVKEPLLADLLPGPVTLVFERSEVLNTDLNPFTSVSPLLQVGGTENKASNKCLIHDCQSSVVYVCPCAPQLVGVRIPDHAFMRRLCQMCGEPLALTSANISSHTSTVAVHEFQELWPKLAVVVDGGPIGDQSRLGSTVVNLSVRGKYSIIRPGCALSSTVDVLEHKYGLSGDLGEE